MTIFAALLSRELRLSLRHGADSLGAVLFFFLTGALFPLAIGPAPEALGRPAPGGGGCPKGPGSPAACSPASACSMH